MAGGGTAGHLLPGLAVAQALVDRGHDRRSIHFLGSNRGIEAAMLPRSGFSYDELPGRGLERRLTAANLRAGLGLVRAVGQGIGIIRRRRPEVVIAVGGHASLAGAVGAVVGRVPLVLHEQNVRAGAVNRLLGPLARASATSFDDTDLPRAVVTGNPVRAELRAAAEAGWTARAVARSALGLPPDRTVIAVFSGSLGSRRINDATRALVERWAGRADVAVRHVTGRRDHAHFLADPPEIPAEGLVYQLVDYEDRVDLLLAAADLAVTRAGAGTCAELTVFGVPAVMVPLPIASRDHQTANARSLVAAGGAVVVPDPQCDVDRLEAELTSLLGQPDRLVGMAAAMRTASHPDAADRLADLVEAHARP